MSGKALFKAGDWQCTKCGNVNWENRKVCNVCGLPKEVDQGERKGAGGGFYERQDPADRVEHSSDDDDIYDAFGRKKKKYRHGSALATASIDMNALKMKTQNKSSDQYESRNKSKDPYDSRDNSRHSHSSRSRSRDRHDSHSRSRDHYRSHRHHSIICSTKHINILSP